MLKSILNTTYGTKKFLKQKKYLRTIISLLDVGISGNFIKDIFMILCFVISFENGYFLIIDSFMTYKLENNEKRLFECLNKFIDM
jgi:hypothetical protein